jgi:hypothetical protein
MIVVPSAKKHGKLVDRDVLCSHTGSAHESKSDTDYLKFATENYLPTNCLCILGSTPSTNILIFTIQLVKDYMHMILGGHMKWLLHMWKAMFTRDVLNRVRLIVYAPVLAALYIPDRFMSHHLSREINIHQNHYPCP